MPEIPCRPPRMPEGEPKWYATLNIDDATALNRLLYEANIDGNTFFTYHVYPTAISSLLSTERIVIDFKRVDLWCHRWPLEYRLAAYIEWAKLRQLLSRTLYSMAFMSPDYSERWLMEMYRGHYDCEIILIYQELQARVMHLTQEQRERLKTIWMTLDHAWWHTAGIPADSWFWGVILDTSGGN
ncbi:hypothetical protein AAL_05850 [Moelleriella libera RCEF 2490]|uniref:Uncharacterized protein n=1 Tax=Moelleriella libera RCEF 2490 TaxID=1081109 RepID=A0A167ZLH3_9HYPO|nr:hypothetical protein AAL_05850 [Moelleriella libera RCEF 2490]